MRTSRSPGAEPERAGRETGPPWLRLGVPTFLLGLAVFLPLLRQTGSRSWDTIWAEDGAIYFQQAHDSGGLSVLFRGYAGYLQLPPRVFGAFSTTVPVDQLPRYFALCGVTVGAFLAWFVWWTSDDWIASKPVRLALASLMVLMPALGAENTANLTDLGWVFAAALPWAFIAISVHGWQVFLRAVVAFTAATATTVSALVSSVRSRRPPHSKDTERVGRRCRVLFRAGSADHGCPHDA